MRGICFLLTVFIFSASVAQAMGPWKEACGGEIPCLVGDRSYHALLPDGWDGTTPMPVLLHFHGWKRTGEITIGHDRIAGATRRRGVLLLGPSGLGRTWDFWDSDTGDVPFAANVLADAAKRFPIDPDRIFVSGYSFGSAMAWRFACESGDGVAALLAVAGTLRQSETCPQAPEEVRHVHGLSDTVMDFPMGPGADTTYPVALWRDRLGCTDDVAQGAWQVREELTFERTTWDCAAGRVLLDLHPRGHFIPRGWIARQLDELLGLPNSYP